MSPTVLVRPLKLILSASSHGRDLPYARVASIVNRSSCFVASHGLHVWIESIYLGVVEHLRNFYSFLNLIWPFALLWLLFVRVILSLD